MESFSRIAHKEKYLVDIVGQSGEEAVIPLVPTGQLQSLHAGDRFKVIQKISLTTQFTWSGDHTVEAIESAVTAVAEGEADDRFVIILSDANFERYGITADHLKRAMEANPKVKTALVAFGEGAEATWLPTALPGKAHRVADTAGIPTALRAILSSMLGGGL